MVLLEQAFELLEGFWLESNKSEAASDTLDQCVDLFRVVSIRIYGATNITGNAYEIWTKYPVDFYDRIPYVAGLIPQLGDVLIWDKSYGGVGHVAVDVGLSTAAKPTVFGQNDPIASPCHYQIYNSYNKILGWLRPKHIPAALPVLDDDQKRALASITVFKENTEKLKDGNLEGAANAAVGAYRDVDGLSTMNDVLKAFRAGVAKQLNIEGETDTSKILTNLSNHIKEADNIQVEANAGFKIADEVKNWVGGTYIWPDQTDSLILEFKKKAGLIVESVKPTDQIGEFHLFGLTFLVYKEKKGSDK